MRAPIDWQKIESFIGYGRLDAPVVFVGMEEGGGGAGLQDDLVKRSTYETVRDLEPTSRAIQKTWAPMCEVMLRRADLPCEREAKRAYQEQLLGRAQGDTLLTEIMPYPRASTSEWPSHYSERFASEKEYFRQLLPPRTALLKSVLDAHARELIVFYGKAHSKTYMSMFADAVWRSHGPFLRSSNCGTRVIIAPHFTSRTFSAHEKDFYALCG